MKFDREQLTVMDARKASLQRESFLAEIKTQWLHAQPHFRPIVAKVQDPLLDDWIAACYDDCHGIGVLSKRIILRYAFEMLRALQLGAGQPFVDGLREYFCSYRHGSQRALEWINYVISAVCADVASRMQQEADNHD